MPYDTRQILETWNVLGRKTLSDALSHRRPTRLE